MLLTTINYNYSSQGKLFSDGLGGKQYGVFLSVFNNFRN